MTGSKTTSFLKRIATQLLLAATVLAAGWPTTVIGGTGPTPLAVSPLSPVAPPLRALTNAMIHECVAADIHLADDLDQECAKLARLAARLRAVFAACHTITSFEARPGEFDRAAETLRQMGAAEILLLGLRNPEVNAQASAANALLELDRRARDRDAREILTQSVEYISAEENSLQGGEYATARQAVRLRLCRVLARMMRIAEPPGDTGRVPEGVVTSEINRVVGAALERLRNDSIATAK